MSHEAIKIVSIFLIDYKLYDIDSSIRYQSKYYTRNTFILYSKY